MKKGWTSKMEHRQWLDAVERHAQGLNEGADLSGPLLAVAQPEDRGALAELLDTARRVQRALASQAQPEPRATFVAQLRAQLLASQQPAQAAWQRPDRRTLLWWAAGAGGVISAAGLGYLAYRAIENGVSGIMAARAARPALSKAQPAP